MVVSDCLTAPRDVVLVTQSGQGIRSKQTEARPGGPASRDHV